MKPQYQRKHHLFQLHHRMLYVNISIGSNEHLKPKVLTNIQSIMYAWPLNNRKEFKHCLSYFNSSDENVQKYYHYLQQIINWLSTEFPTATYSDIISIHSQLKSTLDHLKDIIKGNEGGSFMLLANNSIQQDDSIDINALVPIKLNM